MQQIERRGAPREQQQNNKCHFALELRCQRVCVAQSSGFSAAFLLLSACVQCRSDANLFGKCSQKRDRQRDTLSAETVFGGATVQLNFSSTLAQCQSNVSPNRALLRPSERRKHWPNATSQPQSAGPEASFGSGAVCDYPAGLQLQWASPKGQSSATSRRELQQNCGRISGE